MVNADDTVIFANIEKEMHELNRHYYQRGGFGTLNTQKCSMLILDRQHKIKQPLTLPR